MNRSVRLIAVGIIWAMASAMPADLWCQGPAPEAATYAIQFNRPQAKGSSYRLAMEMKVHSEGSMGIGEGSQGGSQEMAAALAGTVRVIDVNAVGDPTMMIFHVDKADLTQDKKATALKITGADLGISLFQGQFRFVRRDGQAIPKEEIELLSQVFQAPTGVNPDDYLGAGRAVRPGEKWKINSAVMAKALSRRGQGEEGAKEKGLDPANLDGTVTFVGLEPWGDTPCFHLRTAVTIKNPAIPHFIGEGSTQIVSDQLLPRDAASAKSKESTQIESRLRGKFISDDGKKLDVTNHSTVTVETTIE